MTSAVNLAVVGTQFYSDWTNEVVGDSIGIFATNPLVSRYLEVHHMYLNISR